MSGTGKGRFLLVSLAVLALDQWTKWLVETHVALHDSREIVPGVVYLSHVRNTGVAFGLFASHGGSPASRILSVLSLAALLLVGWFFWRTPSRSRLLLAALAMVLGGAFGNLLDRVSTGAVTDFVGVYLGSYRWPDFNVADSAISVGIALMLLDSFRPRPEPAVDDAEA
jgi:signal peptidase II